jgi:uncharacterized protein (DUF2141 family)
MKSLFPVIAATALLSIAAPVSAFAADDAAPTTLTVTVSNIQSLSGSLQIGVFRSEAGWDGNEAINGAVVTVDEATETATIHGLAPGDYALKMYHDVNGDGAMGTNLMGIPTEPFAFSNNAVGRFGPASWDAAMFTVSTGENSHSIALN